MKYRTLGSTGLEVSVVGVGSWQFGGEWGRNYSDADAKAVIDTARDVGINLIDTAECYGDHLSEELVGKSIKGNRQSWIIATKFGHKFHDLFKRTIHYQPDEVQNQLEDSLKSLQTDYIDLYQFHSAGDEEFDTDGLWEMLQKQVDAGKIRHLGISIGANTNIYQTESAKKVNAETIQVVYNRLDRGPEEKVLPACIELNLGVLARVPLASGYLSGKYKPGANFTSTDVRSHHEQKSIDKTLKEVEEIQKNEVPEGTDMAAWALSWCLRNPAVTTVIPGCKSPEQVKSNASAADLL